MKDKIELRIPSVPGAEKVAIEKAATVARDMGFSDSRIEDLKTAVSEACTNAIEHGNKFQKDIMVSIEFIPGNSSLQISIRDNGCGFGYVKQPTIENDLPQRRGWGVYLIRNLVNHFSHNTIPGEGNEVQMVFILDE